MNQVKLFREIALAFEHTFEEPHFDKTAFTVNKKIFATLDVKKKVVVKLSEINQSVFCSYDKLAIYPAKGVWGKKGWTTLELEKINKEILTDALTISYCNIAPKRLSEKYRNKGVTINRFAVY